MLKSTYHSKICQQFLISFKLPGVCGKVFSLTKLSRVDKDRCYYNVVFSSCRLHEWQVAWSIKFQRTNRKLRSDELLDSLRNSFYKQFCAVLCSTVLLLTLMKSSHGRNETDFDARIQGMTHTSNRRNGLVQYEGWLGHGGLHRFVCVLLGIRNLLRELRNGLLLQIGMCFSYCGPFALTCLLSSLVWSLHQLALFLLS